MTLAGKTVQLMNQARRDIIKPALPKKYVALATEAEEESEFLFGSSVCERLEKLKKENHLTSLLDREKGQKRRHVTSSNKWPSYKPQKRAHNYNNQQWAESPQQPKQETIQGEKQHLKTQQEKLIPEVRNVESLK